MDSHIQSRLDRQSTLPHDFSTQLVGQLVFDHLDEVGRFGTTKLIIGRLDLVQYGDFLGGFTVRLRDEALLHHIVNDGLLAL